MDDLHEVIFVWPDTSAQDVIVTGSFDQWAASLHLAKSSSGFEGSVKVPWGTRVPYKFIVDGRWMTLQSQPQERDNRGNINNVYDSPAKPEKTPVPEDEPIGPVEKLPSTNATSPSLDIESAPLAMELPVPKLDNAPSEPVVLPTSDPIPVTESIAPPPSEIHPVMELAPSPADHSSVAGVEPVILPEHEHTTELAESAALPTAPKELSPSAISNNDSRPAEPIPLAESAKSPTATNELLPSAISNNDSNPAESIPLAESAKSPTATNELLLSATSKNDSKPAEPIPLAESAKSPTATTNELLSSAISNNDSKPAESISLAESAKSPPVTNELLPSAASKNDSKPAEPIPVEKKPDTIEFPTSEPAPESNSVNSTPKVSAEFSKTKFQETTPSRDSTESETKTPSLIPSSTPSSPAGRLRGVFESRQRSVSSRSGSLRSESTRSKRNSLFGKVKHLFHLDKDKDS